MDEELEKEIKKVKQKITDYLKIANILGISEEERERQINMMLDDLNKLLKKLK
ncbi:hypothetical protein [uncultured Bacteroides sp.]|uniref:hypothetical protein n=1 Tax=uncultured Bacteroides sp. TaxID=162156 RepID=UPI002617327A|nr:hypothetical protein [uncultured Bacteroides sp.]